ncbi:hypothetical protein FRC09_009327 [Ceratobasidium sp. 395]|nr:hypothetical protein FRC09_009327 [Ceratobasidium sp. 395]
MSTEAQASQPHSPVAVVTGAAQGIGRAIAQGLAAKGYLLALADLPSKQNELQSTVSECIEVQRNVISPGFISKVLPVFCDVSNESQVEALVQTAVTELGGIDVMVANAGILRRATLLDLTDEDFDQVYAVNVKGLLYCYRAAAREMIPRGGGRIIGACSGAGTRGAPEVGAYSASKFAVRGLTQTAAREWGKHGITVNTYAPGPVDTDMFTSAVGKGQAVSVTPTGRITAPEEVASLVSFLASPAARNITGQSIPMNGGLYMD